MNMYNTTKPYTDRIKDLIRTTWETPYVSVSQNSGDVYPIIKRKFSRMEIDHTDGIGTKGVYHWKQRTFHEAVQDALAMNINDLLLMRAVPYKLQSHIMLPEDDEDAILSIVESLANECRKRNIAVTGGETSIHNNIDGLEIGLTVSGFISKYKPNRLKRNDILIGIESSGLHSNGFTKVRELFKDEFRKEFIKPTIIYSDFLLPLLEQYKINGMMHITGGGFTKLEKLLKNSDAFIISRDSPLPQQIFYDIYEKGVSDEEMYKTFNCGIGFVLSCPFKSSHSNLIAELNSRGLKADVIGFVQGFNKQRKNKIIIESKFSNKKITI